MANKKTVAEKPMWFVAASCYDPNNDDGYAPLSAAVVRSVNANGAYQCFKRLCVKRGLVIYHWTHCFEVTRLDNGDFAGVPPTSNSVLRRDWMKNLFGDRLLAIL